MSIILGRTKWFSPDKNTILYYPFKVDLLDHSWNETNPVDIVSTAMAQVGWIDCAQFSRWYLELPAKSIFSSSFTVSVWRKMSSANWSRPYCFVSQWTGNYNKYFALWEWSSSYRIAGAFYSNDLAVSSSYSSDWDNLIFSLDTSNMYWELYKNWVLLGSKTFSSWISVEETLIRIWTDSPLPSDTNAHFNGYLSEVIVEKWAWSSSDKQKYYNITKSLYWKS